VSHDLGRKIACDEDAFLHKIVNERQGGLRYELNGAFASLLRALGFQVALLSARAARSNGGDSPDFDHLTLRVDLDEPWLVDVGFGDSFHEPLRLKATVEQPQIRRIYRVQEVEGVFVLEVMADDKWKREYSFTFQPRQLSEFAARCHYQQTSPESHFTRKSICSRPTPEGRITLSDRTLIETRNGVRQERVLSGEDEWRAKLLAPTTPLSPLEHGQRKTVHGLRWGDNERPRGSVRRNRGGLKKFGPMVGHRPLQ
jgi:N-hydroxyarylamine O-acetyltransferase